MFTSKCNYRPEKPMVKMDVLKKLGFEVGTILKASTIAKSKKPSYEMDSDFGSCTRKSCGQFVRNYTTLELVNKQAFALTNLEPVRIAGIKSEYLTLGFSDDQNDGQAIGITPLFKVANGSGLSMNVPNVTWDVNASDKISTIKYEVFESVEIKSGTIVDIVHTLKDDRFFGVVHLGDDVYTISYIPGKIKLEEIEQYFGIQVPVVTNLELPPVVEYLTLTSLMMGSILDEQTQHISLFKIDKPVKNGLNLF